MTPSIHCPSCLSNIPRNTVLCPDCNEDVTAVTAIAAVADRFFNDALAAANERDWRRAGGAIDAALAIIPIDLEARLLAIKIYARQGSRAAVDHQFRAIYEHSSTKPHEQIYHAAQAHVGRLEKQRQRRQHAKKGKTK